MSKKIQLGELIKSLRNELYDAMELEDMGIKFEVDKIELELEVVASKKGSGGIDFTILGKGAKAQGEGATAATQKIKLLLTPKYGEGPLDITSNEAPEVP